MKHNTIPIPDIPNESDAAGSDEGELEATGLPVATLRQWQQNAVSSEFLLLSSMDAMGRDDSPMRQMIAAWEGELGGPLGGLVGGLPALQQPSLAAFVAVIRAGPASAAVASRVMFGPAHLPGEEGGSDEELNLAFRAECIKQHPQRAAGSLGGLLRVALLFEIARLETPTPRNHTTPVVADDALILAAVQRTDAELVAWAKAGEPLPGEPDSASEREEERLRQAAARMGRLKVLMAAQLEGLQGPYRLLGCSPGSSDQEVEKSYREAAKKAHPEKNLLLITIWGHITLDSTPCY